MKTAALEGYLQLVHDPDFTVIKLSRLLRECRSLSSLLQTQDKTLVEWGLSKSEIAAIDRVRNPQRSSLEFAQRDYEWAEQPGHALVCFEDSCYPALLRDISCPPPLLWVDGNPEVFTVPQFAIVGSRRASHSGKQNAFWIARELSRAGLSICSGLARGIDSEAHRGALSASGITVAVFGTGIDQVYPEENRALAEKLREQGALVSEFPLGSPPMRAHFPQRNRIISGMSVGLLVAEATIQSGSLITAQQALEQNREVFALPGPVNNPGSRGCHALIRNGARLVESPEDILSELQPLVEIHLEQTSSSRSCSGSEITQPLKPQLQYIMDAIGHESCHPDTLSERTRLEWSKLQAALLELEMCGFIERDDGYLRRTV